MKMNQTPSTGKAKVLEVYLEKNSQRITQGTIQVYKNGSIKVSKVKLNPSFLEQVQAPTQMLIPNGEYQGFSLNQYMETLEKGFNKGNDYRNGKIRVREKILPPEYQKLFDKSARLKYAHQ